jgi:AcrR family transcriptional regulator
MAGTRAYRVPRRSQRAQDTRQKIMAAVRELLAEGTFHEATVGEVADRAGIARATLYQHFRSRLDLVDAICDTFDANPELVRIRSVVAQPDADAALLETIARCVGFWSSEDAILEQIYGVAAIDPAARDLVERQRADRRGEMQRLVKNLHASGRLRAGLGQRRALALIMLLTSYESFRELRWAGLSTGEVVTSLQRSGRALLLGEQGAAEG